MLHDPRDIALGVRLSNRDQRTHHLARDDDGGAHSEGMHARREAAPRRTHRGRARCRSLGWWSSTPSRAARRRSRGSEARGRRRASSRRRRARARPRRARGSSRAGRPRPSRSSGCWLARRRRTRVHEGREPFRASARVAQSSGRPDGVAAVSVRSTMLVSRFPKVASALAEQRDDVGERPVAGRERKQRAGDDAVADGAHRERTGERGCVGAVEPYHGGIVSRSRRRGRSGLDRQ